MFEFLSLRKETDLHVTITLVVSKHVFSYIPRVFHKQVEGKEWRGKIITIIDVDETVLCI